MTDQTPMRTKFTDPRVTATGEPRAVVALNAATTLWFNTGTRCNIACIGCYIESSPANDALAYLTRAEVEEYLDQIATRRWPVREIGFTGGEPFMNPDMADMAAAALGRGFAVLILTNAMQPMMRPATRSAMAALIAAHGARLTFRVSLDHYAAPRHDALRGAGSFARTLDGLRWLRDRGARIALAGRRSTGAADDLAAGFAALAAAEGIAPDHVVLFPEMDGTRDVPEITAACWGILGKSPASVMCASSRMVVKRRGAVRPAVVACTLLPHDPRFELGQTLADAERPVALNHRHCATFCVLGGASCSG